MARQSRAPTLLLTRPAPQSQRFAQQIATVLGEVPMVVSPLMQTVLHDPGLPLRGYQAVVFTSETGVEAAHRLRLALPPIAYCVGARTAYAAANVGFEAYSADGNVQDLLTMIRGSGLTGPLLHLKGKDSVGDLAETLTKGGIVTESVLLYTQEPIPLSAKAMALISENTTVLAPVFSPRSARLLVEAMPKNRRCALWISAISAAAAKAAEALDPVHVNIATRPDVENMLHAVAAMYSQALGA